MAELQMTTLLKSAAKKARLNPEQTKVFTQSFYEYFVNQDMPKGHALHNAIADATLVQIDFDAVNLDEKQKEIYHQLSVHLSDACTMMTHSYKIVLGMIREAHQMEELINELKNVFVFESPELAMVEFGSNLFYLIVNY